MEGVSGGLWLYVENLLLTVEVLFMVLADEGWSSLSKGLAKRMHRDK